MLTAEYLKLYDDIATVPHDPKVYVDPSVTVGAGGSLTAPVFILGSSPTIDDQYVGRPFCGEEGSILKAALVEVGLIPSRVYLTNFVKHVLRIPDDEYEGSEIRSPSRAELTAYRPFVIREIRLVKPKVVVCLGGSAAKGLLAVSEFRVMREVGRSFAVVDVACPVVATVHPRFLQKHRGIAGQAFRECIEDFRFALRTSEKQ